MDGLNINGINFTGFGNKTSGAGKVDNTNFSIPIGATRAVGDSFQFTTLKADPAYGPLSDSTMSALPGYIDKLWM